MDNLRESLNIDTAFWRAARAFAARRAARAALQYDPLTDEGTAKRVPQSTPDSPLTCKAIKSVDDQIALCQEFAVRQGYEIAGRYSHRARTGATVHGRDGLLLGDARAGRFQVVIV